MDFFRKSDSGVRRTIPSGQPEVFRDSAFENLRKFFKRFLWLNIRRYLDLDMLVNEAEQAISDIEPQQLRDSNRLR